jgi:hypothetical protein
MMMVTSYQEIEGWGEGCLHLYFSFPSFCDLIIPFSFIAHLELQITNYYCHTPL